MARKYEWDPNKDKKNQDKHGISFADATDVFKSDKSITHQDTRQDYGEDRFVTTGGVTWLQKIISVVWTPRGDRKRLISARRANKKELKNFTEGFGNR